MGLAYLIAGLINASQPGAEKAPGLVLREFENRMTTTKDKREAEALESAEQEIQDRGGARSGLERRQNEPPCEGPERRTGRDRRRGFDRRSDIERRRSDDRRADRSIWDGEIIERRDAFRLRVKGK